MTCNYPIHFVVKGALVSTARLWTVRKNVYAARNVKERLRN